MIKKKLALSLAVLIVVLSFLITSALLFTIARQRAETDMSMGLISGCVSVIVSFAVLSVLLLSICFDRTPLTYGMLIYLMLILFVSITLFSSLISQYVEGIPESLTLNYISNYVQFLVNPFLILIYWFYLISYLDLDSDKVNRLSELLKLFCIIDLIYTLSNIFLGHIFTIDEAGFYHDGKLYLTTGIFPMIGLISIVLMLCMQDMSFRQRSSFIICILFPLIPTVFISSSAMINTTYVCYVMSVLLLYLTLFVERGRDLLRSQAELSRQRLTVMASQIQPHFLYNALTAIMSIPGNPPETKEALSDFSSYLRGNLNVLIQSRPIPFSDELNHTKHYLHLEKLRFEDDLRIVYDIQVDSFLVPALAVQMLAENAVKHGITAKEDGGTLFIGTQETADEFIVIVKDDGMGFTQEALDRKKDPDDRIHIGLENVEARLRDMVGGVMEIRSKRGVGTEVKLKLPKSGQPSGE